MSITYKYEYDIPNLVNNKIHIPLNNYRSKLQNIYQTLDYLKEDYSTKEYGNILYKIRNDNVQPQKFKYQYLGSLEIFNLNNQCYYPNLLTVDMHGLYVQEMIDILDSLYYYWLNNNVKKVNIITGKGNGILYKKLIKYCKDWDLKYYEKISSINILIS